MGGPYQCTAVAEVQQFRLLTIRPQAGEQVHIDIHQTDLLDGQQLGYEALSYTWGNPMMRSRSWWERSALSYQ